jgi:hypothetical protein
MHSSLGAALNNYWGMLPKNNVDLGFLSWGKIARSWLLKTSQGDQNCERLIISNP